MNLVPLSTPVFENIKYPDSPRDIVHMGIYLHQEGEVMGIKSDAGKSGCHSVHAGILYIGEYYLLTPEND